MFALCVKKPSTVLLAKLVKILDSVLKENEHIDYLIFLVVLAAIDC